MNNKKPILILPSWYPPDGGYFFKEHSEAMAKMGWQTDVLVIRLVGIRKLIRAGLSALRRYSMASEEGLRVVRSSYWKVPGNEKYNIQGWARRALRSFRKYERRYGRPSLILAHSVTWAGFAAYLIHKESGIPYVIVEHRSFFVWSTDRSRQMVRSFYLPLFEKAYTHCAKLVLVSESMRKGIEALVPGAMERVMVIPNMISEELFPLPGSPRKTDPFIYLWAGRLEHVKGVDLLLKAVRSLREKTDRDFQLRLAGKGSLRERMEQVAGDFGVSEQVHFLGRLSRKEMLAEMHEASCFVLASRYEAFGVVLIEAMATGLPVIATRSGGPDSIVNPGNGLLVDTESAEELAKAMQMMMDRISSYSPEEIRRQTLLRYGDKAVLDQYKDLFLQVLDPRQE